MEAHTPSPPGNRVHRVILIYARATMLEVTVDVAEAQKERFSHSFLVGIAAAAKFPVELTLNDVFGVDATVRDRGVTTDWQLKGTSSPKYSTDGKDLLFDLDMRTYSLFTEVRNSTAYLGVVVLPKNVSEWIAVSDSKLVLRHTAYWQKVTGLEPTVNTTSKRIRMPLTQRLTVASIKQIMQAERVRLTT